VRPSLRSFLRRAGIQLKTGQRIFPEQWMFYPASDGERKLTAYIPDGKKDEKLLEKLKAEASGILNWAL